MKKVNEKKNFYGIDHVHDSGHFLSHECGRAIWFAVEIDYSNCLDIPHIVLLL